eukprot:TRINITY_DN3065_c0_g1_i1.p3 TRINITY_DN3065_c0_g1~~TRINITY_DN3065_c0_g1_i1.p3  ORF type:complete len:148 (-),score=34.10 TRINITY_DN3065_c0_g1_i1:2037-2480(-)
MGDQQTQFHDLQMQIDEKTDQIDEKNKELDQLNRQVGQRQVDLKRLSDTFRRAKIRVRVAVEHLSSSPATEDAAIGYGLKQILEQSFYAEPKTDEEFDQMQRDRWGPNWKPNEEYEEKKELMKKEEEKEEKERRTKQAKSASPASCK